MSGIEIGDDPSRFLQSFRFALPTRLVFGPGSINELSSALKAGRRVLIVCGTSCAESGLVKRVRDLLAAPGRIVDAIDTVPANPTLECVSTISKRIQRNKIDAVVGCGGGSAMDAAKLGCALAFLNDDPAEFRVGGRIGPPGIGGVDIPVITIPTLGGSGSEVSPAAVVSIGRRKEVFYSPNLFPTCAIVDPQLATTAPLRQSLFSAFDAFVQGLEAFTSRQATPFSDCFAEPAIALAAQSLPRLHAAPKDSAVRAVVAIAGILSLLAINQAGVGAAHALAAPITAHFGIPHGAALGVLLPEVCRFNFSAVPVRISHAIGLVEAVLALKERPIDADVVASVLKAFVDTFVPTSLPPEILETVPVATLVEDAQNPDLASNPVAMPGTAIADIYLRSLGC